MPQPISCLPRRSNQSPEGTFRLGYRNRNRYQACVCPARTHLSENEAAVPALSLRQTCQDRRSGRSLYHRFLGTSILVRMG